MTPEQALNHIREKRKIWGKKAVVGISGPGEPLANPQTFETLKLIKANYPSHPLCLCTNGFLLKNRFQDLARLNIKVISITLNGIDPEVVEILQPAVKIGDVVLVGKTAASDLIDSQISGLKMAVAAGMFVKINTVIAEGINDAHMITLARFLSEAGAGIMNIMPVTAPNSRSRLIPPDARKLEVLRSECEKYIPQFRLCRQCRSDAAGIPGIIEKRGCCG
jgi:nitrogen fixation protein NifB